MVISEQTTTPPHETPRARFRWMAGAMVIGAVGAALCWWAAGATLGLYLGALFVVTLAAPLLAAGAGRSAWPFGDAAGGERMKSDGMGLMAALLAGGSVVDGVAIVLLGSVLMDAIGLVQWLAVYVLMLAYAAALVGVMHLMVRMGVPRMVAGGVAVIIGLAWLTWPVWLSAGLTEPLVAVLSPCHPVFALNAVLLHLGLWSEQAGVIYPHTRLNQDFLYALPVSIWPAVVLHVMVCVAGGLPALWRRRGLGRSA